MRKILNIFIFSLVNTVFDLMYLTVQILQNIIERALAIMIDENGLMNMNYDMYNEWDDYGMICLWNKAKIADYCSPETV